MKVCWFGIYDPNYSRNNILMCGLKDSGVSIVECNVKGKGIGKYIQLVNKLRVLNNNYDVIYCAFPVHISIFFAFLFQKKPIVVDAFFPKFDSVIYDRKTVKKYTIGALWFYLLDYAMVKIADKVIVDSEEHQKYWGKYIKKDKIEIIPIGVNTSIFKPETIAKKSPTGKFIVQYHGTYIPLQGLHHVVRAISILKNESSNIHFRFIGKGQLLKEIKELALKLKTDIEFIEWAETKELVSYINESDIVLGIFGDTLKADRVIPNKLYEGLAVKKPVITKDTVAVRSLFTNQEIVLSDNTPKAIADSILLLRDDKLMRKSVAEKGYKKCIQSYSQSVLGKKLVNILKIVSNER